MSVTSAAGIISLLQEPQPEVKLFALNKLNDIVNTFWPEISEAVVKIEELYEDDTFKHRKLAALVASKVYYHLGAYEDSLTFALGADNLFNVNDTTEYVETIVAKCIDHYIKLRVSGVDGIDVRLEAVVNRMFQRCFEDRQYKQALGIALETRREDMIHAAIQNSNDVAGMLSYALRVCLSLIENRQFRMAVLRYLVQLYQKLASPDYINICQCLIFLDDAQGVAQILEKLLKQNHESLLMGYQIAFDLYESATQQYLQRVQAALKETTQIPITTSPAKKDEGKEKEAETKTQETPMEVDEIKEDADTTASTSAAAAVSSAPSVDPELVQRMTKLHSILSGDITIGLHQQFLIRNNKTDLLILKNTKEAVRNSVCHNATVVANAFMHCGTTSDTFLRDNLEWLGRATNWAKFTATASLGVIHMGHEKEALHLMSTYLPKESGPGSSYSEGGGLYALGMIHANHGRQITEYLSNQLKEATTDVVRHGGCLGLGLAAMGTAKEDIYELLKSNLYQDDAITGEAAGIAMGLVMLGTNSEVAIENMVAYAQETQHEKILRGLAIGIALTVYGRLEEADGLIENLSRDKDPILRWSGMYAVGMAYCGTGNNRAIRRLLHVAVSDVNDDVRRTAVTSLGFLLFRMPEQCPSVVSLLSESYNPHVRYGAAMALGIACAGTGLKEAIALLEPMTNDPVNYVRQGALIASALILIQHNENTNPKLNHFRQLYAKVIGDKHEDVMAKFGAILAQGIIDAGGRNVTISLQSRTGHSNMAAMVGLMVFCQFWYWYPLTHFLALAFTPTCLLGLNVDLNMPKIDFKSNAKPSVFAYPPPLEEKKDKSKEKVETAVLSITAKQKKKEAEKKEKKDENKMEVDEDKKEADKEEKKEPEKEATEEADKKDEEKKKKEPEPSFEMLKNPARVMRAQLKVVTMSEGSRYVPMKDICIGGIIMLRNARPDESEDIIELVATGGPKGEEEVEPEPPEPFEWKDD